jgi:hypothetical protein
MKKDLVSSYSQHASHRHPTDRCPGFITDLILRCAAGDKPALGSLFDLMYPLVNAIVGGAAPSDSDETRVVATFHRLWDQAPAYDPKLFGSVEWVLVQARAVCAEELPKDVPNGPATLTC